MTRLLVLAVAGGIVACSGSAFESNAGSGGSGTGGSGTGGSGTGGSGPATGGSSVGGAVSSAGSVGVAGSVGAGGGTSDRCSALWNDYLAQLDEARACELNTVGQCSLDSTLPGSCGCLVFVNPNRSDQAQAALDEYTQAGCIQGICGIQCPLYTQVHCQSDASGSRTTCTGA